MLKVRYMKLNHDVMFWILFLPQLTMKVTSSKMIMITYIFRWRQTVNGTSTTLLSPFLCGEFLTLGLPLTFYEF